MAYDGFAIDEYLDAEAIVAQLDVLKDGPIYGVKPEALKEYEEEYFEKKCQGSKERIAEAKQIIPGGVQHNLAFNYPFPMVMTKAEGAKLYDIDGNEYYDLLQAGGPTVLGSNPPSVREKVIDLLNTCGPSTGLFHEYEYKLAKLIAEQEAEMRADEGEQDEHPGNGSRGSRTVLFRVIEIRAEDLRQLFFQKKTKKAKIEDTNAAIFRFTKIHSKEWKNKT